jgi:hypothetical protein
MENEGSLTRSEMPATSPYPEPDQSILSPAIHFRIYPILGLSFPFRNLICHYFQAGEKNKKYGLNCLLTHF